MVLGALMACPVLTNAQDWQSTSSMPSSGSNYSSQVTEVGATGVVEMGTTTETYSPAQGPNRAKRGFDTGGDAGQGPSPVGDAVLPLMLMALAFGGFIAFKRRKQAANN